jgi:prepilin-type N-terminal cleavage/methylation domain-containing protein
MTSTTRNTREAGFTLIEMMLAVALLGGLLVTLFLAMFRTQSEATRITTLVEQRQSSRAAIQLVERDVRMSGSGWGRIALNVSFNGSPLTYYAVTPGPGAGANDSIQIIGAWAASTTITDPMPNPSANIKVADPTGFSNGDLVVITNGSTAHMFECTAVNTSSNTIQHNPSSPYNNAGGHSNWPASGYGPGSQVFKINILSYKVDSTTYRRPALIRRDMGSAPAVVAYDVDRFQVWYRMQDGTLTRNPTGGVALIDRVRPILFTKLKDRTRPTYVDSLWAEVQPRTF